jgi:hypothetical protein
LLSSSRVDVFVDNIYNFPTLAEAYRIAALDIARQRWMRARCAEPVCRFGLLDLSQWSAR